jgi:2-keto-4-pentenoate hydratase/2-oxohepta-3-ene-1,7-dioic acid hydratase in catechol pathway
MRGCPSRRAVRRALPRFSAPMTSILTRAEIPGRRVRPRMLRSAHAIPARRSQECLEKCQEGPRQANSDDGAARKIDADAAVLFDDLSVKCEPKLLLLRRGLFWGPHQGSRTNSNSRSAFGRSSDMRFVTVRGDDGRESVGALIGEEKVLNLTKASEGASAFASMISLIESGEEGLAAARRLLAAPAKSALSSSKDIRLAAPIPRPPRMRAFSLDDNHLIQARSGYARLMTSAAPDPETAFKQMLEKLPLGPNPGWYDTPVYMFMDHLCVSGPDERVVWPAYSNWVDYELEIGAVVGKAGRNIAKEEAKNYIFGYTILNDLSARDSQWKVMATGMSQTAVSKDFEGGYPMGPCIITSDELTHREMEMTLRVNGEEWGRGSGRKTHWGFDDAVAYASQASPLVAGEVMSSAAVSSCTGLEQARKGQRGDCVELEVKGIGTLRTWIV